MVPRGYSESGSSSSASNLTNCPIGFLPSSDSEGKCACYSSSQYLFRRTVKCEYSIEKRYFSVLLNDYCLTKDGDNQSRVISGISLLAYSNYTHTHNLLHKGSEIELPPDPSQLEDWMCGPTNRAETLCSECNNQSSINVNSVSFECVPLHLCGDYSWIWYAIEILAPLTAFFVFIMIFQPILTSPEMYVLILLCQILSIPINIFSLKKGFAVAFSEEATWLPDIITALYGLWNLDIVRYVMPTLCFTQQPKAIHVLALDYITAMYPLLLMVIVYVLYELHHNCGKSRLDRLLAPPARFVFKIRRIVNPKASPLNAFANFLLLSHTKLVTTTIYMLLPVALYDIDGSVLRYVMYFDASVNYFSSDHLPFAILALVIFTVFVTLPAFLLLFFQWAWFQKLLEVLHLKQHCLVTFVDIFHSYYKDRFDCKRDYRFFAGAYFFLHIFIIALCCLLNGFLSFLILGIVTAAVVTCLFVCINPYKQPYHNKINAVAFLYLAILFSFHLYMETMLNDGEQSHFAVCVILAYLSFFFSGANLAYITFKVVWKLCLPSTCRRIRIFQTRESCTSFEQTVRLLRNTSESDSDTSFESDLSMPDRVSQHDDYVDRLSQADSDEHSLTLNEPYSIQELPELS